MSKDTMIRSAILLAVAGLSVIATSALTHAAGDPRTVLLQDAPPDPDSDPLPAGAIARLGSPRVWRGEVDAVAFSPDGKTLAAGIGTMIQFWDVATARPLHSIDTRMKLRDARKSLRTLAFSPDGKVLASGVEDEGATIWDANTGKKLLHVNDGGWSAAFSADGRAVVFADRVDRCWDTSTWEETPLPGGNEVTDRSGGQIFSVAISPDGKFLATGSFKVHVLNLETRKVQAIPARLPNCPFVAFTADSKQLATAGGDSFRLWDLATGKDYQPFGGVRAEQIAVARKSSMAAWVESYSNNVYLGDLATERMAKPLRGHQSTVKAIAFSGDGKILASGSRDGTVLLWNVSSQELLQPKDALADRYAADDDRRAVPADAKVSVLLDKKEYFLGENILVHFVVENAGKGLFSITMGGDYRGASRALSFHVTATDAEGKQAADPDPSGHSLGGIRYSPELKPGQKHYASLQLRRYRRLERPGVYTIRVAHNLGWRETPGRKIPVAEATLKVLMPDAKQACAVVEEMYRLPRDHGGTAGQKRQPFADFGALAYPVYLPWLTPRAAEGDEEALAAIGVIAAPEATKALIELAGHKDAKFALSAVQTLNHRLPDPELEGKLRKRNVFLNDWLESRRWLVSQSWKPDLAPSVRKIAGKLLQENDVTRLQCGGYMLQCLGTQDDVPALVRALDAAVAEAKKRPPEQHVYPRPRGACTELLRAANVMVQRGIDPPLPPRLPGERILFAQVIQQRPEFRPKDWEATYAALLDDEFPFVRQVGLDSLPEAPPKFLVGLLPKLLLDADLDVQTSACQVAGKLKAPELRVPLLKVLNTAKDDWLLRAASAAAYEKLVPRLEYVRVFVNRLDEEGMANTSLEHLMFLVKGTGGRSGPGKLTADEAKTCKQAWEQFLRSHAQEVAAGQTYAVGDPRVPIGELFPRTEFHPAARKAK